MTDIFARTKEQTYTHLDDFHAYLHIYKTFYFCFSSLTKSHIFPSSLTWVAIIYIYIANGKDNYHDDQPIICIIVDYDCE